MDKRSTAALLKRFPWVNKVGYRLWRIKQPWVTIGAVGVVFNDKNQVLVVEHVFHPKFPWGLPGGWMNRNENPDVTVRREILEETNLRVDVLKPLLIEQTLLVRRHLDMAYLCYAPPGADIIRLSSELMDYQWVEPSQIMPLVLFHRRAVKAATVEWQQLRGIVMVNHN